MITQNSPNIKSLFSRFLKNCKSCFKINLQYKKKQKSGTHLGMDYILQFRNWLLGLRDRQEATRRDIYKRTEAVLHAFLNGEETYDMFAEHAEYYSLYGKQTN